ALHAERQPAHTRDPFAEEVRVLVPDLHVDGDVRVIQVDGPVSVQRGAELDVDVAGGERVGPRPARAYGEGPSADAVPEQLLARAHDLRQLGGDDGLDRRDGADPEDPG